MATARAAQAKGWQQTYAHAATIPYWTVHAMALVGMIVLGMSGAALAMTLVAYVIRMFFVTGAYHRYFSHRSYKTSRAFQLVLALGAVLTVQRGVLWWAAHTAGITPAPTPRTICTRPTTAGSGGRTWAG